jgi:Tfp pilus assembly PilM family ATPase
MNEEMPIAKPVRRKFLSFQKKGPAVALDIENDVVRIAETSAADSLRVSRLATAKLELPENAPTAEELGAALKKAKISRPKAAYICVPRAQVVLRPLIVPNVLDVRELASIINFQIGKDLPFRIEDAVVDFKVLRLLEPKVELAEKAPGTESTTEPAPAPQARLEVLVGAIKNDSLTFFKTLATSAGFNLAGLGLRSSAYLRVLQACKETLPEAAVVLVVLRQDEITIEIIANDALALSRVINVPLPGHDDDAEKTQSFLNALALEVVRSVHSYDGMMWHKPIGKAVVAGTTGLENAIAEAIGSRLRVNATVFHPSSRLELKSGDKNEIDASFAAIGLSIAAQDPGGLPIDFLHPKKPAVPRNTRRNKILIASAAAMVGIVALFGIRAQVMKTHNKTRAAILEQLTDAEKKLPIYRKLKSQTKSVKTWLDEEQDWLDHLAYISGILPGADQLYVNSIATTSQRVIRMSVQAKTGELLAELDKKLRAAGYEIKPLSITPASDKYGYNFRTTVELNVPKKMKVDIQKVAPPKRPEDDISKPS